MTARTQRRQAERKARKAANKTQAKQLVTVPAPPVTATRDFFDRPLELPLPNAVPTQADVHHANAQKEAAPFHEPKIGKNGSTGPRTPEGKAASSQNNFRHGLTGNFAVLDWENLDRYVELSVQLHEEHQPATMTEYLLVERMAQHQWLSQRAVCLQNLCFNVDAPVCEQEKQLALYLRYGTTHDRAFGKCLADLLKLRAQRTKEQNGFESQKRQAAAEARKQEVHQLRVRRLVAQKPPAQKPVAPSAVPEAPKTHLHTPANAEISNLLLKTRAA